ncbi:MAG: hypothetical protein NTZ34_11980 [Chloroflexi bacterium]|nr:hypothetical protein [Chloroflexota bacterium]
MKWYKGIKGKGYYFLRGKPQMKKHNAMAEKAIRPYLLDVSIFMDLKIELGKSVVFTVVALVWKMTL